MGNKSKKYDPIICKCNEVPLSQIEAALANGAKTLNEFFDQTSAGVGACGGSCRKCLKPLLDEHLERSSLTDLQLPSVEKKKSF